MQLSGTGQPSIQALRRVAGRPTPARAPLPTTGAADFARSLVSRYDTRRDSGLPVDRIVHRLPVHTVIRPVRQHAALHLTIAPTVTFTGGAAIRRDGSSHGRTTGAPASVRGAMSSQIPATMTLRLAEQTPAHRRESRPFPKPIMCLVQRLAARQRRIESVRTGPMVHGEVAAISDATREVTHGYPLTVQPVPFIVQRPSVPFHPSAPVPGNGQDEPWRPPELWSRSRSASWAGSPASPEPPALDLTDLTDRVVAAIDRRIIAQRERVGRW